MFAMRTVSKREGQGGGIYRIGGEGCYDRTGRRRSHGNSDRGGVFVMYRCFVDIGI